MAKNVLNKGLLDAFQPRGGHGNAFLPKKYAPPAASHAAQVPHAPAPTANSSSETNHFNFLTGDAHSASTTSEVHSTPTSNDAVEIRVPAFSEFGLPQATTENAQPESLTFAVGTAPATILQIAASTFAVSAGSVTFDLIFDAAAMAAPVAFRNGIEQAAALLASVISDKITINLNIDYSGTGGGAAAGPDNGLYESYSSIRSLLVSKAAPGDTTFNSLPNTSTIQGQSNVAVWNAQLKAFGLMSANSTTTDDGSAYFATDINSNLLIGVALHELTHAMGRVPFGAAPDIFDLFRFTSAGVRLFSGAATAPAAYFSLDGGVTKLADFGRNSDPSDFLNGGVQGANDPFNEFYTSSTSQALSAVDLKLLAALGFHLSGSSPAASPDLSISGFAATGTTLKFALNDSGIGDAGASTTGLYLSTHATPTTADTLVGSFSAAALAAGGTQAESIAFSLPATLAAGTYYLAAIADKAGQVAETSETNNTSTVIPVVVGSAVANTMAGTNAILFGLAGNDTITSNGGNSVLIGGAGNDTLYGGAGADQFVFNTTADGMDYVRRFAAGDHIDLAALGFGNGLAVGGANTGVLDASHFVANATGPTTVAQEFWYNTTSHILYFDAQGSTAGSQEIAIAQMMNGFVLHNTDLWMV
jgi:Ca2+-binding RTX toxin-like protein